MKNIILIASSVAVLALPISAQSEHSRRSMGTILTGDDDLKVEVWRGSDARAGVGAAGASAIRQPVLEVIFAGSGWRQSVKDEILRDLSGVAMPEGVSPATIVGGNEFAAPARVNDLGIQRIIDFGIRDGSLTMHDANVIHVVLLAPSVRSTLGAFQPHVDYESYHSHFHTDDTKVRYVVVPWNDHVDGLREAMVSGTLLAVLNPDGD